MGKKILFPYDGLDEPVPTPEDNLKLIFLIIDDIVIEYITRHDEFYTTHETILVACAALHRS